MEIEIINIKNYEDTDYVYIGRPSEYGNPYSSKESGLAENVGSKEEALNKFRDYIEDNPQVVDSLIKELKENKVTKLGCWCSPSKCHGEILVEEINKRKYKSPF
jgi:hypothetical protein